MHGVVRTRVLVSGRVQGVFFRESARTEALRLGLGGWVRNLPDGRVEAVFEGAENDVAAAIAWCRTGPPRAYVTYVEDLPETPEGLEEFTVRRT